MDFRTATTLVILSSFLATASATDIYLPSLPGMADYFASSADALQATISIYLFAQVLSAPAWGALSDHFNRKKILLAGMIIFILGSVLCALATNVPILLCARSIQGIGAIAPYVIGWATISEIYAKEESAKVMSLMGGVMTVAPLLAPIVGGEIDGHFGWRANFIVIIVISILTLLFLGISKFGHKINKEPGKFAMKDTLAGYVIVLKNRPFVMYVLIFAFLGAGEFAYLAIAPFYLESIKALTASQIGMFISFAASSYIIGALAAPKIINWLGTKASLQIGVLLCLASGMLLLIMHFLSNSSLIFFAIGASSYLLGLSIAWGPSTSNALNQISARERGRASAVRSLLNTLAQASGAALGSLLPDTSLLPLAGVFLAASTCAMVSLKFARKN